MKLRAISLFTGVGGLDYGFEAAGFDTCVALDVDSLACDMIRRNRDWPVIESAIADVTSKAILQTAGLRVGEADVLIGGPPCQPFSKSSYWAHGSAKRLADPRADTLIQYLRVLEQTLPKTFLLENVPGLAFQGKSEGIEAIRQGVDRINKRTGAQYAIHVQSLNAADYGVPQLRERVFIVGAREGQSFEFPRPTHAPIDRCKRDGDLMPYSTAWDALADVEEPMTPELKMTGKWASLLPTIPEGKNYLWHTDRGGGAPLFGWRRRYWNFLLKLSKQLPSWTVQAQPGPATGPFHWENRKLSARELGRLQTMPDDIRFECSRSNAQRLVGNAVPSALGEVLAREIAAQLLGKRLRRAPITLLPPTRLDVPRPIRLRPLPLEYRVLIGREDAHPGTGKGRRALNRAA